VPSICTLQVLEARPRFRHRLAPNALTRDNGLADLLFLLDKGILDSARIGALHGIFAGHASSHQVIGYSGSI